MYMYKKPEVTTIFVNIIYGQNDPKMMLDRFKIFEDRFESSSSSIGLSRLAASSSSGPRNTNSISERTIFNFDGFPKEIYQEISTKHFSNFTTFNFDSKTESWWQEDSDVKLVKGYFENCHYLSSDYLKVSDFCAKNKKEC